jgi:hypothetical protein
MLSLRRCQMASEPESAESRLLRTWQPPASATPAEALAGLWALIGELGLTAAAERHMRHMRAIHERLKAAAR